MPVDKLGTPYVPRLAETRQKGPPLKAGSTPGAGAAELAWLRKLARTLATSERSVADDLAQEAMLAALRGGAPSEPAACRGWLVETMRRIFFGHVRTAVRRRR